MDVTRLCEREFERLVVLRDPAIGLTAFVVLDDTRAGPAFGGIRRWTYADPSAALEDALALAASMTLKCAISGVPGGGGKTVLMQRDGLDRAAAYRAIGRTVEELGGRYYTGPDVGTTAADLDEVAKETERVALPSAACGDLAEPTALGVFAGIEAVARRLGAADGVRGLHVAVQGLGEVGRRLVARLAAGGARLSIADLRADVAEAVAITSGAAVVSPNEIVGIECDVFAPCALGGVVQRRSIDALRARGIAGSANNVLAEPDLGVELARRGIVYAPDFVISSGALIHGALFHLDGTPPPPERVLGIGATLDMIFERAARDGAPPERVAFDMARDRLERVVS